MRINLSFEGLTPEQANGVLAYLGGAGSPNKLEKTTARHLAPETLEPESSEPETVSAKEKSKYSIESIRKASKDIAREKGQPFVKQALEAVGATSISQIEPDKFDDFMNLLAGEQ